MLCESPDYNNSDFSETKIKKNKSYDTHITNQFLISLLLIYTLLVHQCMYNSNVVVFDILTYKKLFFVQKSWFYAYLKILLS